MVKKRNDLQPHSILKNCAPKQLYRNNLKKWACYGIALNCLTLVPDLNAEAIYIGMSNGTISIYDATTMKPIRVTLSHPHRHIPLAMVFDGNNKMCVSTFTSHGKEEQLEVINAETGQWEINRLFSPRPVSPTDHYAISTDPSHVYLTVPSGHTVQQFPLNELFESKGKGFHSEGRNPIGLVYQGDNQNTLILNNLASEDADHGNVSSINNSVYKGLPIDVQKDPQAIVYSFPPIDDAGSYAFIANKGSDSISVLAFQSTESDGTYSYQTTLNGAFNANALAYSQTNGKVYGLGKGSDDSSLLFCTNSSSPFNDPVESIATSVPLVDASLIATYGSNLYVVDAHGEDGPVLYKFGPAGTLINSALLSGNPVSIAVGPIPSIPTSLAAVTQAFSSESEQSETSEMPISTLSRPGSMYVAVDTHSDDRSKIQLIDVKTLEVKQNFDVPVARPEALALGGLEVYVAGKEAGYIDPVTQTVATIPDLPSSLSLSALAWDGRRFVYGVDREHDQLWQIDVTTQTATPNPLKDLKTPSGVAWDGRSRMYVSNEGNDYVSVIDEDTFSVVAKIPVGHRPQGMAWNGGRGIFVANRSDNTVSLIDTKLLKVVHTISVPGSAPHALAYDGLNGLYVAGKNGVSVINTDIPAHIRTIHPPSDDAVRAIAWDGDTKIYAADAGPKTPDVVWIIDTTTLSVVGRVNMEGSPVALAFGPNPEHLAPAQINTLFFGDNEGDSLGIGSNAELRTKPSSHMDSTHFLASSDTAGRLQGADNWKHNVMSDVGSLVWFNANRGVGSSIVLIAPNGNEPYVFVPPLATPHSPSTSITKVDQGYQFVER